MRCPIHPATQTPSALGVAVRSWLSVCAVGASAAFAASPPQQAVDVEAQLNVLSRLEARTLQLDTDVPVWVYLEGESFQGQSVQLEQKGLIIYEQKLFDGNFRIKGMPPLDEKATLTVRLRSPNQADEVTELPLKPNQRRELYAKRPELLALAPANIKKDPLSVKLPPTKLEEDVEFDLDFLRGKAFRNLSPLEVKRLGNVRPGDVAADIYRNDSLVSKTTVRFTEPPSGGNARACITPALFQQLGVKTNFISPQGLQLMQTATTPAASKSAADCLYIDQWVAGATSEFDTNELRLDITIAQAFLTRQNRQSVPSEMLTRGENAGFINYNLNNYNAQGFSSNYLGLNTGVNIAGWQVRHTSYLSQNRSTDSGAATNTSQYVAGETVVKRPLIDMKASLAFGDTSTNSPIIGSTPIRGVRLSSEEGLMPDEERGYRPVIKGVARTNARVRVSQNNAVFFEQTVPPGPFEFDDINPIASVGNLQVVIAEADGSQQTFVVPYSPSMGALNPGSFRYSVATGQYRNFTSTQNTPVLQAYLRYGLNSYFSPGMEVLVGPNYSNVGVQAAFSSALGSLSFNALFSHFDGNAQTPRANGYAQNFSYNPPAMGRFNAYAGLGMQSQKYTTPSAALNIGNNALFANDSFKNNAFLGLGFSMGSWGGVSLGASQQRSWLGVGSQQVRWGYSIGISRVNLGVNVDHTTYTDNRAALDSVSVFASIPLSFGPSLGSLRGSYNQYGSLEPNKSLSYSGYSQENQLSYSLTQSQSGYADSSSASLNVPHRYGNLSASLSSSSGGSQQTGLSASGGLVVHSGGLILAPSLGDTFAIVEVPKGEGAGVLGSTARVNSGGFGVVPYLSPYYLNDVQISLEGAPTELEVDNASQKVAPVEGSIVRLKFNATSGRPLLIVLQPSNGARVPIGSTVSDAAGNEVGTVGQGSRALVRVQKNKDRLKVVWGDKPDETCWLDYALDEKQTANASGFTNLKLRCEVTGGKEATAQTVPTIK